MKLPRDGNHRQNTTFSVFDNFIMSITPPGSLPSHTAPSILHEDRCSSGWMGHRFWLTLFLKPLDFFNAGLFPSSIVQSSSCKTSRETIWNHTWTASTNAINSYFSNFTLNCTWGYAKSRLMDAKYSSALLMRFIFLDYEYIGDGSLI